MQIFVNQNEKHMSLEVIIDGVRESGHRKRAYRLGSGIAIFPHRAQTSRGEEVREQEPGGILNTLKMPIKMVPQGDGSIGFRDTTKF